MTTDASRDAVEALGLALHVLGDQAEIADNGPSDFATTQHTAADTLAALLDERDALQKMIDVVQKNLASRNVRIRDLEADLRKCGLRGEAKATEWREALERAERAEAERDRLAAELAQVKQCRDEYGDEIDVANARADRAEAKLDAVTAQRFHEAYERLAPEFGYRTREASAVPWADVPEQNKRLMEATVAAILADTETREEGDL